MNNVNSTTGNTKAIPFGSSEVLSEDKKQWPAAGNVVRHGSKSSQEREIDQKLLQNRATNRPVTLNIGGTKYEVSTSYSFHSFDKFPMVIDNLITMIYL